MYRFVRRALIGEKREERTHDRMIFEKSQQLAREYDITYDGTIVPDDEDLADSVFEAGLELLLMCGIYCIDTGRVIELTEDEVVQGVKSIKTVEIGRGTEKVSVIDRDPMDARPPVIVGGPGGGLVSEEHFVGVHMSSIREIIVQGIYTGVLETLNGERITAKTPMEMYATLQEARLVRYASRLSGRPGLAMMGPSTPTLSPSYMLVSEPNLFSEYDPQEVYLMNDLKVDFEAISKAIYHLMRGNHYITSHCPVLGSASIGSPEGLAIVDVAETIQAKILMNSSMHGSGAIHINTNSSSTKEVMWASNISAIALSRNLEYYTAKYYWNSAGCCTDMMFYESAVQTIGDTVCGRDILIGPVGRAGRVPDHSTGIESRFVGEVSRLALDLSLSEANEVAEEMYSWYSDYLTAPPQGKQFSECYELVSEIEFKPTKEYQELYEDVFCKMKEII
jgi:methylamine--corrinoid protein Co-methyltransferase